MSNTLLNEEAVDTVMWSLSFQMGKSNLPAVYAVLDRVYAPNTGVRGILYRNAALQAEVQRFSVDSGSRLTPEQISATNVVQIEFAGRAVLWPST